MSAEAQATARVDPKNLFDEVSEGDQIDVEGSDEPLTVYRHVTEDDVEAQAITMRVLDEEEAQAHRWSTDHDIQGGDLIKGELTGDEFLVARGPRGAAYILTQWWNKEAGQWYAEVSLYRRTRSGRSVWSWENTVDISVVDSTDVDRDEYDAGIDAVVRHTDLAGRTAWASVDEGDVYHEYDEKREASYNPRAAEVTRHLYESGFSFSATDTLILLDVEGEADEPPNEAVRILQTHGWERDESQDMAYDPWENGTIFGFRPTDGGDD